MLLERCSDTVQHTETHSYSLISPYVSLPPWICIISSFFLTPLLSPLQFPALQVISLVLDWCHVTPVPETTTSLKRAAPTASPVPSMAPPPSQEPRASSSVQVCYFGFIVDHQNIVVSLPLQM